MKKLINNNKKYHSKNLYLSVMNQNKDKLNPRFQNRNKIWKVMIQLKKL